MQLVMAHIDGVDPACAALQQKVGKTARGCACIQADKACHVQGGALKDGEQLVGAAAHILLLPCKAEPCRRPQKLSRLVHAHRKGIASFLGQQLHFPCHNKALCLLAA